MDANARTGRRGGGKLGGEEYKVLGAYGLDTLNDSGELLLSLSANHELALSNTFFSTAKNAILHTFNGQGKKKILTTFSRDSETENSCGMLLCTPNCHFYLFRITTSSQHMLNCFVAPPPIDRRRLTTDPHLREEVASVIRDNLRAFPPRLPLRQPYCRQHNGLRRRERPGCRGGDEGETPRQKQISAW